jgi:hypothetical protein
MKRRQWAVMADWIGSDGNRGRHTELVRCAEKVAQELAAETRTWHAKHDHTDVQVSVALVAE